MLTEIELMQWIEHFGRWNVQDLIAKRQDMWDVITYLRAERSLELAKFSAFVTSDSVRFEREEASPPVAEASVLCAEDGFEKIYAFGDTNGHNLVMRGRFSGRV